MESSPTLVSPGIWSFDAILGAMWRLDPEQLDAIIGLGEHIRDVRARGPNAAIDARILYTLAQTAADEGDAVPLAAIRDKLVGLGRADVDEALLRLDAGGRIVLLPGSTRIGFDGTTIPSGTSVEHPTRGTLERCALVPARRQSTRAARAA